MVQISILKTFDTLHWTLTTLDILKANSWLDWFSHSFRSHKMVSVSLIKGLWDYNSLWEASEVSKESPWVPMSLHESPWVSMSLPGVSLSLLESLRVSVSHSESWVLMSLWKQFSKCSFRPFFQPALAGQSVLYVQWIWDLLMLCYDFLSSSSLSLLRSFCWSTATPSVNGGKLVEIPVNQCCQLKPIWA